MLESSRAEQEDLQSDRNHPSDEWESQAAEVFKVTSQSVEMDSPQKENVCKS